ncbi:MAG: patatin-like phospholipase family protein [Treponema sp.]|nr:patatin-like phospholipase family protein [Treponema sp.]
MRGKALILFLIVFFISLVNPACEEYGLVLSGGGGKGAYEVGVWKAMNDYGIAQKVTAISGTSVGGLNAALFCCYGKDLDSIEEVWLDMVPSALTYDDELISQRGLESIINIMPLYRIQEKMFPRVTVTAVRDRYKIAKYLMANIFSESYATRFILNDESDVTEIKKELLATSAFPVICDSVQLKDGFYYMDGGGDKAYGGDNVPITPIIENNPHIQKIIVVYLQGADSLKERIRVIDYDDKDIIEVIPSIELGGLFDGTVNFSARRIRLLIRQGYEDAEKIFKSKGFSKVSSYWFD